MAAFRGSCLRRDGICAGMIEKGEMTALLKHLVDRFCLSRLGRFIALRRFALLEQQIDRVLREHGEQLLAGLETVSCQYHETSI